MMIPDGWGAFGCTDAEVVQSTEEREGGDDYESTPYISISSSVSSRSCEDVSC